MTLSLAEAEKVYEDQIKLKQGEAASFADQANKERDRRDKLKDEADRLQSEIQKKKDAIAVLEEQQKKAEEDFKKSRANSIASLDKRDKESQERLDKADKRDAELKALEAKVSTAKNGLIGLGADIQATVSKVLAGANALSKSVEADVAGFLALKEAQAPKQGK